MTRRASNGSPRCAPLRILFFIDNLDSGGTQRQLTILLDALDPGDADATVATYQPQRSFFRDRIDESRVRVLSIEKRRRFDPTFLARLVRTIREGRYDVVQTYLRSSNVWGTLAGRLARGPVVVASERRAQFDSGLVDNASTLLVTRLCDHLTTNSEFARNELVHATGIPRSRTSVIWNGVPEVPAPGPPPERGFVISMAATFVPNKNHAVAVRAFERVFSSLPQPAELRLMGNEEDGAIRRGLERELAGRPAAAAVKFLGRRKDVLRQFAGSHAVILPSFYEAFPNVLIEAMLSERPVLASDVCEHPRIVGRHGERGLLFDPRRVDDVAARILQLASRPAAERREMGGTAREWVLSRFSVDRMVADTMELYRSLVRPR